MYKGSESLWHAETEWSEQPFMEGVLKDDPEVKIVNIRVEERIHGVEDITLRCILYFSGWMRLKNCVAWVLILKTCLRSWVCRRKKLLKDLMNNEDNSSKRERLSEDAMMKYKDAAMCSAQHRVGDIQLSLAILEGAEKALCAREQQRYFKDEISKKITRS